MESYGALLRKFREQKELSIDDVERDTTITRQYLEALESEDEEVFPGEPYLVGFLKNYSDYLGADSNELLKLYHAKRMQETPVPPELLAKTRPKFLIPLIVTLSVLVLGGVGCYLYFFVFKIPEKREMQKRILADNKKIHQYQLTVLPQTRRLYVGDKLLVGQEGSEGNVVLTVCGTIQNRLTLETPSGQQIIELGEERELDVNGDRISDVIVWVADADKNDKERGAEVRMSLKDGNGNFLIDADAISENIEVNADDSQLETSTVRGDGSKQVIILEDSDARPFTLNITFRGPCLFRYWIDFSSSNDKIEEYYKSGDSISITSQYRGIRLWMSNSNALQIQVVSGSVSKKLEVGKAGQILVEDIKWVRSDRGRALIIDEVD